MSFTIGFATLIARVGIPFIAPALVPYLNEKNQVGNVCVGTNKKNSKQYYYDRPCRTGDFHGQGPYLWCAAALMEK